ncbi:hypothetical protein LZ32DRAFT_285430 [Colletotrichum eremochloae]|nr:hypothetical protein LZ32DRAFT_285430 [Colletotrichum eremochloae]
MQLAQHVALEAANAAKPGRKMDVVYCTARKLMRHDRAALIGQQQERWSVKDVGREVGWCGTAHLQPCLARGGQEVSQAESVVSRQCYASNRSTSQIIISPRSAVTGSPSECKSLALLGCAATPRVCRMRRMVGAAQHYTALPSLYTILGAKVRSSLYVHGRWLMSDR